MSTRNLTIALVLILSSFCSSFLQGQGFAEIYHFGEPIRGESLARDNDGDFYIFVHEFFDDVMVPGMIKTDPLGDTLWIHRYPEFDTLVNIQMHVTEEEDIVVVGYSGEFGEGDFLVAKLNSQTGDIIWQTSAVGSEALEAVYDSFIDEEGSIYVLGASQIVLSGDEGNSLVKVSSTGEVLWYFEQEAEEDVEIHSFTMNSEGDLALIGTLDYFGDNSTMYFTVSATTGELLNNVLIDYFFDYTIWGASLGLGSDGKLRVMGYYSLEDGDSETAVLTLENDYSLIDYKTIQVPGNFAGHFRLLDNGNILQAYPAGNAPNLALYNPAGELMWHRVYRDINENDNATVIKAIDFQGGFAFTGVALSPGFEAYLAVTDADGYLFSNEISGNVFWDDNMDCAPADGEISLGGRQVKFSDSERDYYRYTDENGDYSIVLDTGTYTFNVLPPNDLWTNCADEEVTFSEFFSTPEEKDLPLQTAEECAILSTYIHTNRLRRCQENYYGVTYSNNGTIAGENVYLEVQIDEELTVVSSNPPFTSQVGNLLTYDIGTVPVFEGGGINITVFVPCDGDVELGLVHCSQAEIFPQIDCFNTQYNGASIEVRGTCLDDASVHFEIENIGDSPMASPLEFIVIEDEMILRQEPFDLNPGEVFPIDYTATGNSFITSAEQEAGHPGFSMPIAFVEGCGGFNGQSTVTWFPLNDNDAFIDMDCHANVDSYDPNDKTASPRGFGDEHFIEPNTDISYLIRFQNEGNDTAYQVVVIDTLTSLLDVNSLILEGRSFPYELAIRSLGDEHELTFIFNEINLLPKAWDEAASQGYLSYKVKQQADLPLGTVIENRAGIYFDFNAPIITNTAFHTLGLNFIDIVNAVQFVDNELLNLSVNPNPISAEAVISLEGLERDAQVELHDLTGKIHKTLTLKNGKATLRRGDLVSGFYVLKVVQEGEIIGTGKVVLH